MKPNPPENGGVTGLVLSGGGAYAAYEVGVLRALFAGESPATGYRPIHPNVLSGTSAGGFNAALIVSLLEDDAVAAAERLARVWLDELADPGGTCGNGVFRFRANALDAFGFGCPRSTTEQQILRLQKDTSYLATSFLARVENFISADVSFEQRTMELVDVSTILSTDPFTDVIRRNVRVERIRNSPIQLLVATTAWRSGDLRVFIGSEMTEANGHDIIRASAAVPGVFDSVEVDGEPYVDGGVVMNTPLRGVIDAGADSIHIVYINPDVVKIGLPRLRNTVNSMFRAVIISWAAQAGRDIENARRVNIGLRLLEHADQLNAPAAVRTLIQHVSGAARKLRERSEGYRFLTIHRYSPRDMNGGLYRWLSFEPDHIFQLIQQGYADTIAHDCAASSCVLPEEDFHA